MATRVNLMKMLQEARGLAEMTSRRPHPGQPEVTILSLRSGARRKAGKLRRTLPISIQEPPDIPTPVRIVHRKVAAQASQMPEA